jgi:hypothetical protein
VETTSAPRFRFANRNHWCWWVAISSLSPICSFSFMGRKKKLNLDVRNIFAPLVLLLLAIPILKILHSRSG